jgi:hypothetical protein
MSEPIPSWKYNPLLKQMAFDCAVDSPGSWLFSAFDLKTAADRIDWLKNPIREEEPSLSLASVYRMLMGMSIEVLLKGILVAQGEQILDDKGRIKKDFAKHDLTKLAQRIDTEAFAFSQDDLEILDNLTPYIKWAGKYPLPRVAGDLIVKGHSSGETMRESGLWERLYEHLKDIGWVTKGDGKRLYFNRPEPNQAGPPNDA